MGELLTEREQIELLKKWGREYGIFIALAVIIGLAIGLSWHLWRRHTIVQAQRASVMYNELQEATQHNKFAVAQALAQRLLTQYRATPYAAMAGLLWARNAVQQNQLRLAITQLRWVMDHAQMISIKQIARLRAARILLAQHQPQRALILLQTVDDVSYQPLIDRVTGDIYQALGQQQRAQQAYRAARAGLAADGIIDPLLAMKITS